MNELNKNIARFYNRSTQLWLDVWGEHMHQGFYGKSGREKKDRRQAQIDLISELINWAAIEKADNVLDAGCGVGGSARYFNRKFNSHVTGYTLSGVQANNAREFNQKESLEHAIEIIEGDMMQIDPERKKFDLIWSLESAEHIADKKQLINLFYNLLLPGGKLIIATWCVRQTPPDFTKEEKSIIEQIRKNYHLPPMISIHDLSRIAESAGFKNIVAEDWSKSVVPFWNAVYTSALKWKSVIGLIRAGWPAIKGAYTIRFMQKGYRNGSIQFGVMKAEK